MIKGEKRKNYNDFEEEVLGIKGDFENKYGLEYFFEHIYHTFDIAEKEIKRHSEEYNNWFKEQDFETRQSIHFYDVGHEIYSNPLTETLYKSHFITIHSEFENTWKEIIGIHNNYFSPRNIVSLNDKFLTPQVFNANCLLDKVVINHKILINYNYIRNKIVHQNAVATSLEYQIIAGYINLGDIKHLKTIISNSKVFFIIENIQFIRKYSNEILNFITNIADTSFHERHPRS